MAPDDQAGLHRPSSPLHALIERGAAWVALQLVLFGAIALAPALLPDLLVLPPSAARASGVAGALIGLAGLLIGGAGAVSLGRNLTIFPRPRADASLVQHGIYSIVRHPIYSGVLLSALGWSLLWASLPAVLLTLVLGCFFDLKTRREERWLEQTFPEYAAYRCRVRKLIPWVY